MLNRLPLAIVLPLCAAAMVAVIGIGFGLLFLEVDHMWGPNGAVFVATGVTAVIMAAAALLHQRTNGRYPSDTTGVPEKGGRIDRPGQPWEKGPEDPTLAVRERRRSSRANDRKRTR